MPEENPVRPDAPRGESASSPEAQQTRADGEPSSQPLVELANPAPGGIVEAPPMFERVFAEPAPREIWRGRDLLTFVVLAVVWLIISQFGCLAVYAVLKPIAGWQSSVYDMAQNAIFAVVTQVIYYGPLFLYVYILVALQYRLPFWEGIRWRWPGGRQAGRIFVAGIVLAIGLVIVEAWLPQNKAFPLEKLFASPAAAYTLAVFSVTVAPFMEEIIFRGVFFAFFERMVGIRFALVSTALLFALIHAPEYWGAWSGLALILVVGLACSTARAITKSVVPGVILHVAYNGTLMGLLFIGSHHFRTLPGR